MTLLIDTADVPARERMEFWSECSRDAYHPVEIRSPDRDRFWARMWGYELGPISLFRIVAAANTMIRTSRAITSGDPECLHFEVVLRGEINAAQEGRTGIARCGDVISYETSHPAIFRADGPFETLVVRIPKSLLGREADEISGRTAVAISGCNPLPKAAATFFTRLVGDLEARALAPDDAPAKVDRAVELIQRLYGGDDGGQPEHLRSRAEILLSIESFIEENLGDPDLEPDDIARASFISTRYLHKLFELEGTSVCRWIRRSRLECCRRDLLDPELGHRTILAIASQWGLPGPQHFSRVFRAAYGLSPRELRRQAKAGPQPAH